MGVDSKGYCLTTNKNVFKVSHLLEKSIDSLLVASATPKGMMRYDEENKWTKKEIVSDCSMLRFCFTYKGEERIVHFHFGCDSDGEHDGLIGPKLIFSLGMWGENKIIIRTIAESLRILGPVYLQMNDSSDAPLDLLPPSEDDQEEDQSIL